jgi:hypothetical protein
MARPPQTLMPLSVRGHADERNLRLLFFHDSCHAPSMRVRLLMVAAIPLLVTTGCGSHNVANQSKAALAAMSQCQARFNRQFHLAGGSKAVSEGFVQAFGDGRLRVSGRVPARAGLHHAETYTCVVVPGSSGPHVVTFDVKRSN